MNIYNEYIKYNLSDFEFGELCHLETIKLIRLNIDDSFNQNLSKTNLKKIYLYDCIFINEFEFKKNEIYKHRFTNEKFV